MREKTILVWFRNDLRLHDNELLVRAREKNQQVVPFYCFDPRHYAYGTWGLRKTGSLRAAFLLDNVKALQIELQNIGSNLITAVGYPEEVLPEICKKFEIDEVYHHREVAQEETYVSGLVEEALWKLQINLKHFIGHTLYHKEDLPFPIKDIPDAFSVFRKKTERESQIRPSFETPLTLPSPTLLVSDPIPTLADLGYSEEEIATAAGLTFKGGEKKAFEKLQEYLQHPNMQDHADLSPYLAVGSLSPNTYYHALIQHHALIHDKKARELVLSNLLWRDYFRFMFKKHGNKFFSLGGLTGEVPEIQIPDDENFERWKSGQTGNELVDHYILLLRQTGFIPNKARFLLAAYLIQVLKVNWLKGAAFYEEQLLDYGPSNNYGNWAHVAGVGSSLKENKPIDIQKLSRQLALPIS
jgi:deoxyribodipyrimidine photo-lyase